MAKRKAKAPNALKREMKFQDKMIKARQIEMRPISRIPKLIRIKGMS